MVGTSWARFPTLATMYITPYLPQERLLILGVSSSFKVCVTCAIITYLFLATQE